MQKYILLLAVSLVWIGLYAQSEFAPVGSEWYYTHTIAGCCPEHCFNHIISEKDTIVGGNSCRVIKQYPDNSNTANEKYIIKQEQGKVYYYYQDQFNLLFDFDAGVNDTIEFTFMYKKYDAFPSPLYKDTILSVRFKVENITTNAQNLKTFRTKILDEDAPKFHGVYYAPYTYTYTEKIGWHSEFIPMLDNAGHPDADIFRWLRCYSDADFSFVSDEWASMSLPCNHSIATGFNALPKEESSIVYPNPFKDNVFVFTNDGKNVEVIDVSGKTVHYSKLSEGMNMLSTNQLLKGLFFVKIQNKNNSTQIFKIIKL
ncbi:MAG: T9SS type A sorting domain-containing protein [Dysgonamonadaceae bacterium]|jgi:hypothetical protein|nr:T9SS type A sorting domain-containing protein [Dysgonamonadaceae bacterium]